MKKFSIIVAKSKNDVIGSKETNSIPWYYKSDMEHFKNITKNTFYYNKMNGILMGYNTWKSLGVDFLPERINVVIDRTEIFITRISNNLYKVIDFETAIIFMQENPNMDKIFMIGGSSVYNKAIKHRDLDKIYVTKINKNYEGDVLFPKICGNFKLESIESEEVIEGKDVKEDVKDVKEDAKDVKEDAKDVKEDVKDVKEDVKDVKEDVKVKLDFCIYKKMNKPHPEYQYIKCIKDILENGYEGDDRTGIGTLSVFGRQFKWDLEESFPLFTTKRMYFRGIVEELLWFLRGETDNRVLQSKGVHIWDGNTSRNFLDNNGLKHLEEGDGGKIYGFQMRHQGASYINCETNYKGQGYDQVEEALRLIKENPTSRRIVINLWNAPDMDEMALPPCLFFYQFRVYGKKLHCHILNRSNDMALGHPWNVGTGALMTYIFAKLTGLKPGSLTHSVSDAHLYLNNIDDIKEQLDRKPFAFPHLKIKDNGQKTVEDFKYSDFVLKGYEAHPSVKMTMNA